MAQCQAKTRKGKRCLRNAEPGKRYCKAHADRAVERGAMSALVGAVGGAAVGGPAGLIAGGVFGYLAGTSARGDKMAKTRVFVSFDFDNDRPLKEFILGQAKNPDSPFEVVNHSLKEAAPEREWEAKAKAAITRAEIVLVMVGPKTYKAPGVLKEIAMARALDKKVVQIIGYKDGAYTPVPNAGTLYKWNWPNLKKLLA